MAWQALHPTAIGLTLRLYLSIMLPQPILAGRRAGLQSVGAQAGPAGEADEARPGVWGEGDRLTVQKQKKVWGKV